jgi:hypothetical protein
MGCSISFEPGDEEGRERAGRFYAGEQVEAMKGSAGEFYPARVTRAPGSFALSKVYTLKFEDGEVVADVPHSSLRGQVQDLEPAPKSPDGPVLVSGDGASDGAQSGQDTADRVLQLQRLLSAGAITQEEYDVKKDELLERL